MDSAWKEFALDQLYDFRSGLSKPRSAFGSGFGFLSFKDVFYNYFVPDRLSELVQSTEKDRENCSVERGDVFLTRTSETMEELGMSCVALRDYESATFNGFTKRLRPKNGVEIVPEYAGYFFRSPHFRREVTAMSTLSTRASLNNEMLARLKIILPTLEQQRDISSTLKCLDDKIELNRKMNETLEAIARAIFKSWFVDFDPVRAKAEGKQPPGLDPDIAALFPDSFQDSPLGKIPKGWEVGVLRDLCSRVENGGTPKRKAEAYWSPPEIPWLTSGEVRQDIVLDAENYISKEGLNKSSAKIWPAETTVVAMYGATAGEVTLLANEMCTNQACCGLIPKENAAKFLYLKVLRSSIQLSGQARGSAQQNLSQRLIADFPTLLPPNGILRLFESTTGPLFERWVKNLWESRTLAELRDTLLPRLLSGEIRVNDAEVLAEVGA